MEKEIGRQVLALRLPSTKKNYDTMVHNQKQFADIFRKHGCYARSFQLDNIVTSEGFIVYPIFSRPTRTTMFGWT